MYFSEKEKRYSGNWWKTWGMRDSREKRAGMRDQDPPPPFQTLIDEADPVHDHAKVGVTKRLWQYIKAKRRDCAGIAILKSHGKEFTKPKKKADILNEQRVDSVFTLEDPVPPQLHDSPYPDMPNIHIDNSGVIKLLSRLNPSKANGPDLHIRAS